MPTKITFHSGVNEVGGNRILLSDNDTNILLDFGEDSIETGLVPDIEGVTSGFVERLIS